MKVLVSYSHSGQAADLRLCRTVALGNPVCSKTEREASVRPSRDRIDKHDITDLITAYHEGATAASHDLSLTTVKRASPLEHFR